jgi:FlaA1/EpsC-like NDP-sugar epimerase
MTGAEQASFQRCHEAMVRFSPMTPRKALIIVHDLLATATAIVASFYIRFEEAGLSGRLDGLLKVLPGFVVYAGIVYSIFHLYEGKWRFASLPDLSNIFRAVTVLAFSLLVLDYILVSPLLFGTFFFGKITITLYWCLQMFFLGGPRIAYRYFRHARTRQRALRSDSSPILVLGHAADADVLLRGVESGAVKKIRPVGILSPSLADQGQSLRGISVLGQFADLERIVADLECACS